MVRLTRNFVRRSRITFRHRSRDQNAKFWKFKMADGRHFENGFITISRPGIIRFWWNLVCRLKFWFKDGHMLIYKEIYEIQNGGQPSYWKLYFGYISTSYRPIDGYLACTSRTMLRHTPHDENSNVRKLKIADGRHFENGFDTIFQPRIIRFHWNLVCHCRFWF